MNYNIKTIERTILFLTFLVISFSLKAQQINGIVSDAETKEPLGYISVYYEGTTIGTRTNFDGTFSIPYRTGKTEITFSAIGYKTQVIKIDSKTRNVNVKMSSDKVLLDEVVIKIGRASCGERV